MITLVTGSMGSGKSYYVVDYIFNNRDKYYKIVSNISGLKYEDNITSLNYSDFRDMISEMKIIYDDFQDNLDDSITESVDDKVIEYLIEKNILKKGMRTLFVIDEAHNYFKKVDEDLLFLCTYQRHVYFDIFLITQDYKLFHHNYYPLMQERYDAIPSSKVFLSNYRFKYIQYMDTPYNKDTRVRTLILKKRKEVFDLYHSGDAVNTKSIIWKFLIQGLIILVVLVFMFNRFMSSFKHEDEKKEVKQVEHREVKQVKQVEHKKVVDYSSLEYIKIECISKVCKYKNKNIDEKIFKTILDNTNCKILSKKDLNRFQRYYYLLKNDYFDKIFESEDEKSFITTNF